MANRSIRFYEGLLLFCCLMAIFFVPLRAWAQTGSQGTITVTVTDESGGVVPGADLTAQNLSTNDVHQAPTQSSGTYSFIGLNIGIYKLTITKPGYEQTIYSSVTVEAARVTDVEVELKVGAISERVEVRASESPLVDVTSNAIGTTIDMKEIEDLPLTGRDLGQLAFLVAGWGAQPGAGNLQGTFNGLPGGAILGGNIDGVPAMAGRYRSGGLNTVGGITAGSVRIENIQEMTIQTDQIDLSQGFGTDVQVNFVTRQGTNNFHGRAFDNFQNDGLNANTWFNDDVGARKAKLILNDFGVGVGGPILKNKLFFFANFSETKQPGSSIVTSPVLTSAAQQGLVTYTDTSGNTQTVNVLQIAQTNGLPFNVDTLITSQQTAINTSLPSGRVVAPVGGADPNLESVVFQVDSPTTNYFPAVRLDYNASPTKRFFGSWNFTKYRTVGAYPQSFPGPAFAWQTTGFAGKAYTTAFGFDWTASPTVVNQFRAGFLYSDASFSPEANSLPVADTQRNNTIWAFGASGSYPVLAQTSYYPLFNVSDSVTWQHHAHAFSFGAQWYREQDHYWNPPLGWEYAVTGLGNGDPAFNVFTTTSPSLPNITQSGLSDVQSLYATLTGDMAVTFGQHPLDPKTKQYVPFGAFNLDEVMQSTGLFFQDSYRIRTNLTLNYGLRWDFVQDDHDLKNTYYGASVATLYAPSGMGNEFKPGTFAGTQDPQFVASGTQYNPFYRTPQPSIGISWSPSYDSGWLSKLTGGPGQSVVRAGYSLRNYLEGQQNFWVYASNFGSFFYQNFARNAVPAQASFPPGDFQAGTYHLSDANPPTPQLTPASYQPTYSLADTGAFQNQGLAGLNPHIQAPYVQSWNFGIQRALGKNNALEVRYVGNRGTHEWIGYDINEVNIFENGFLKQFQQGQANLTLNNANAVTFPQFANTFAYNSAVAGEGPLPIFDAAFAPEGLANPQNNDYSNGQFTNWLMNGAAGSLAQTLAGGGSNPFYICNLVGSSFTPCANAGSTTPGTYPANFFQVNPYEAGQGALYLNSIGYSTFNALQIDFRQKSWHGMQFNLNYSFGKSLGTSPQNNIATQVNFYTIRNERMNYQPSAYDIRQVFNASGVYDLPFGEGKQFLNHKGLVEKALGRWTLGTIIKSQTGAPFQLTGGWLTFNNNADGGVNLTNITRSELQKEVGVFYVPASGGAAAFVDTFNPSIIAANNASANPIYLTPNTTAGTLTPRVWLYGPHYFNTDLSIAKAIPIHERVSFVFQGELLNAFNHPNWGNPNSGVNGLGFGVGGPTSTERHIELRANIEF